MIDSDILVAVVLYNMRIDESPTLTSILPHSHQFTTVIYDNSIARQHIDKSHSQFLYVHDCTNPGVSKAFNSALEIAIKMKKKWLILFDQDTNLPKNWFTIYSSAIASYPDENLFVPQLYYRQIISPFRYYLIRGWRDLSINCGRLDLNRYFALNSGMMIRVNTMAACNGFDENIPLYFSDFAFLSRLRKIVATMRLLEVRFEHNPSNESDKDLSSVLFRFKSYCLGAKRMIEYTGHPIQVFLMCLLRTVKQSIKFKSFRFISVFIKCWALSL